MAFSAGRPRSRGRRRACTLLPGTTDTKGLGQARRDQGDEEQEGPKTGNKGCSSTADLSSSLGKRFIVASNTGSLLHHSLWHRT